jgi:Protein of unknown function (DUF3431)
MKKSMEPRSNVPKSTSTPDQQSEIKKMMTYNLLQFLFGSFNNKRILQFAGKDEMPLLEWIQMGGEIDYIGRRTSIPLEHLSPEDENHLHLYHKGASSQPKSDFYDIIFFDDRQSLYENITSWNEYHTRLAPGGIVLIRMAEDKRHHDPLANPITDAWFDQPPALGSFNEPAFSRWLELSENLQSIHFPQIAGTRGLTILQRPPLPAKLGEIRLCVASYGEDLSWLKHFHYDRCVYDATGIRHGLIPVPNRAREAGQYIRHIITNYGNFADFEVFLQAHPYDHSPNLQQDLAAGIYRERSVRALGRLVEFDYSARNEHERFAINLASDIFGGLPHALHWTPGAQFSASRKAIMSRSLDFWKRLLRKIESEPQTSPWAIERLWLHLF